jgi:hypothetical protein
VSAELLLTAGSSQAMAEHPSQRQVSVEEVTGGLQAALRAGVRPARLRERRELLGLRCVRDRAGGSTDVVRLAFGLEAVIRAALDALGDGPQGRAAELLLGAVEDTRGLPLRERRRQAAYALGVMPSTFRQNYEDELLEDVAAEVLRIELAGQPAP